MKANITRATVIIFCCTIITGACASLPETTMERAGNYNELLDSIISQEIDEKKMEIESLEGFLRLADMTIDNQIRITSFINKLNNEIDYLNELMIIGVVQLKRAYCMMVLDERIMIMSYEVQFKESYGDRNVALPKSRGRQLRENEMKEIEKNLKKTVSIKYQVYNKQ